MMYKNKENGQNRCDKRRNISSEPPGQAELDRCERGKKASREAAAGWPPGCRIQSVLHAQESLSAEGVRSVGIWLQCLSSTVLRANTGGSIRAVLLKLSKLQDRSSKLLIADWRVVVLHTTSTRLTPQAAHHACPATTKSVDFLYDESTYMSLPGCCGNVKSLYVSKILSQFLYTSHCGKISNSWLASSGQRTTLWAALSWSLMLKGIMGQWVAARYESLNTLT